MRKVAVIGGGIVGSTAAYYLSQANDVAVTLFDAGEGQATKAAAGIICPWFSKRRNKPWYRLVNQGAHFYPQLLNDMATDGLISKAYQQKTTWIMKKKEKTAKELLTLAKEKQADAPLIQSLNLLTPQAIQERFPEVTTTHYAIETDAGAIVDGEQLCVDLQTLAKQNGARIQYDTVRIERLSLDQVKVAGDIFDAVILATGAWLSDLLSPHGFAVDIRPQKGQLAVFSHQQESSNYPLIMLEGEGDLIPHQDGQLFVGATHEDDKGFDLTLETQELNTIFQSVQTLIPDLTLEAATSFKVGTRAYTSDYAPFFGEIPEYPHVLVASGLGSSGLTSGPIIGHNLAQKALNQETTLDFSDYPVNQYLHLKA